MPAYYTKDGGRLAPHPNMTDEELEDFEEWADEILPEPNVGYIVITLVSLLLLAGLFMLL